MRILPVAALFTILAGVAGCATESGRDFPIFFPTDDMALTPDAQQAVANVAKLAGESHASRIVVSGDADGGTPHDAELAYRRAATVVQALQQAGIAAQHIQLQPGAPGPEQKGVAAHKVNVRLDS
jgi:outer membrane protein OmpA-like peptidoglycan-associated protein